jgi:predicted membrane protein
MDDIIKYISSHQFIIGVCVFAAILILFFLFKKLIKFVLLSILVLIVFVGYLCFKEPEKMPKSLSETIQKTKESTRSVVEKGRGVYDSAKGLYKKAEKLVTRDIDKQLEPDKKLPGDK